MLPVVTTKLKEHKFLYVSLIDKLLIVAENYLNLSRFSFNMATKTFLSLQFVCVVHIQYDCRWLLQKKFTYHAKTVSCTFDTDRRDFRIGFSPVRLDFQDVSIELNSRDLHYNFQSDKK